MNPTARLEMVIVTLMTILLTMCSWLLGRKGWRTKKGEEDSLMIIYLLIIALLQASRARSNEQNCE